MSGKSMVNQASWDAMIFSTMWNLQVTFTLLETNISPQTCTSESMIFLFPFGGICDRSLEVKTRSGPFLLSKIPLAGHWCQKLQHSAVASFWTQALMVLPISVGFPSRWETGLDTERFGGGGGKSVTLQKWTQWIQVVFLTWMNPLFFQGFPMFWDRKLCLCCLCL